MKFPPCLSEAETIERAIAGANLARYGDGEFNLARGGNCKSQKAHPKLAAELRAILDKAPKGCLPCLPDPNCGGGKSPKRDNWLKVTSNTLRLGKQEYGSAFITRPDSAPWIDTKDYWSRVRALWRGKDVTLVKGSERSLRLDMMTDAKSVREVWGTYRDAYDARGRAPDERDRPKALQTIDELMEAVGVAGHTVLMCLGPTATVMAARLARKGVHAVDLGHLGMFMRSAGAYLLQPDDLLSPQYRALLTRSHSGEMDWAGAGYKQAPAVAQFADEIGAKSILDYGSGQGTLARALPDRKVTNYDPGVAGSSGLPKLAHLVVSSDVLEHIEPDKLDNVMKHIHGLAVTGAYFMIATRPANKNLPDGRNAHLLVESPDWWLAKIDAQGWKHAREPVIKSGHSITMWLLK